jgi:hypothetical protein
MAEKTAAVTTADECAAYVDHVGLCAWRRNTKLPSLPSLEAVTAWDGDEGALMDHTWFWKDDLHIEKRLFYGQLLFDGVPAFVSLSFLPTLIAAQGDIDPRTLYEQNRLARPALDLYEAVERNGPTASNRLPGKNAGERTRHLVPLQQRFLLTKHGLTGRTRGTYGYIWGLCDAFFPDAFRAAARISVADARAQVIAHLNAHGVELDTAQAAKLFRWMPEEA